jgi:fatty acid-binding protein DegV
MMSGRLPKIVGKIGMFLKMRPIMSLDKGKGAAFGLAFSKKGITKKILKLVEKDKEESGIESYSIVHCNNEPLANEYKELFTQVIGKEPDFIAEISSATAIHSGVGSVAIGYIKK